MKSRYAMLTVDTEALSRRAESDHVNKLIWGRHSNGTAGVAELSAIGDEYNAKHVFFVDMCGAYTQYDAYKDVVSWLCSRNQDVQLHTHSEYLPRKFWEDYNLCPYREKMNTYDYFRNFVVLRRFSKMLSDIKGEPVRAFRAGSFRWNQHTLSLLKTLGITMSFNNSMAAYTKRKCVHSIVTNNPFRWGNGVIEVPATEQNICPWLATPVWDRFSFPFSKYVRFRPKNLSFLPFSMKRSNNFVVCVLHSWSLLSANEQNYFLYKNDEKLEKYRSFLRQLTKDYDVITTADLQGLINDNKIILNHTEDMKNVPELHPDVTPRRRKRKRALLEV